MTERNVWLREHEDGTAILAGSHLPPHRAGAAYDPVDRLARAARAEGDARTLSQLRADAMLDLLTGLPFTVAPSVDPLTAEGDAEHEAPSGEPRPPGEPIRCIAPGDVEHGSPPDPLSDRIDLYDYDRYCLTDADRWWLDQLRACDAEAAGVAATDRLIRYADLVSAGARAAESV